MPHSNFNAFAVINTHSRSLWSKTHKKLSFLCVFFFSLLSEKVLKTNGINFIIIGNEGALF